MVRYGGEVPTAGNQLNGIHVGETRSAEWGVGKVNKSNDAPLHIGAYRGIGMYMIYRVGNLYAAILCSLECTESHMCVRMMCINVCVTKKKNPEQLRFWPGDRRTSGRRTRL